MSAVSNQEKQTSIQRQIHNQESNTACGCLHIHCWLYKWLYKYTIKKATQRVDVYVGQKQDKTIARKKIELFNSKKQSFTRPKKMLLDILLHSLIPLQQTCLFIKKQRGHNLPHYTTNTWPTTPTNSILATSSLFD